ncbi:MULTISPECIES: hypothetical protein [Staphylococcus]|uniref:Uncharacterized protein n=1 Tax=Staphylococcus cohnii TaxID=29382 RepID=A0A2T4LP38_9STAP|nr:MULTISPECIES: hypothetical protein [Staphylococcus]MCE5033114.1 hypothetical protein [Staphylococcus cohnii]MCE5098913.1 hypothetical protein [Staphylococcus cohnii]MSU28755.1 hypothetical protein [Staphylococcus sp. McC-251-APC-3A2]PTF06682.1 hypothetical protein BUY36_05450 [Staphylococcus cohnii]PTF21561.1 hypothetical protein BUY40_01900 [Staphylococcus cohnii]
MESMLLVALLLPVIYLMQMIKMKTNMRMKHIYNTLLISTIGVTISSTVLSFLKDYNHSLFNVVFGAIVLGVIWALLLCGCYYCYQVLAKK